MEKCQLGSLSLCQKFKLFKTSKHVYQVLGFGMVDDPFSDWIAVKVDKSNTTYKPFFINPCITVYPL